MTRPDQYQQGQQPLLDVEPLRRVAANEQGRPWAERAEAAMRQLEHRGLPFTADDLRNLIGPDISPHHPNAIGALFNAHRAAGYIQHTGWHTSTARKRNGGSHRVWTPVRKDRQ